MFKTSTAHACNVSANRAQLLLIVVTRSRDLSRECHVTKHKTPARSNFPMSNFENSGTIQFSSSTSTSRGLCPKNFEKRAHPNLRILSKEKYSKASEIPVGVKVEFNESTIMSAEYFDCTYCHMPEIPGNNCPSPAKNTVSATGKLIKSEFKQYDSGLGLKVGVQHGDITTYFVLFQGDVWFDVLKKMSVGDELTFKGVLHKNDDESRNNLVKLFYVRLL